MTKKSLKHKSWIRASLWALGFLIFIRMFILFPVSVNDSKMSPSLKNGDLVIVNQLKCGWRLPMTLLSIPFTNKYIPFTRTRSYIDALVLSYLRFPSFTDIKRNEIIAFNYPMETDVPIDKKEVVLKRCIGLPGDTVALIDKKVFTNMTATDNNLELLFRYRVVPHDSFPQRLIDKFKLTEGGLVVEPNIYEFYLSTEDADSLRTDPSIKQANLLKQPRGIESTPYFPQSSYFNWNNDYFGPVAIPKKHTTVDINTQNIDLYKRIIEIYEGNKLTINDTAIFINDTVAHSYTFKMDYYFVLDDNRDNAKDSRFWGFIPEDHIIGTASFIYFSFAGDFNEKSVNWHRFLKNIK